MTVLLLVCLTQSWLLWKFIRFQLRRWREFRHEQAVRKKAATKQVLRPLKRDSRECQQPLRLVSHLTDVIRQIQFHNVKSEWGIDSLLKRICHLCLSCQLVTMKTEFLKLRMEPLPGPKNSNPPKTAQWLAWTVALALAKVSQQHNREAVGHWPPSLLLSVPWDVTGTRPLQT